MYTNKNIERRGAHCLLLSSHPRPAIGPFWSPFSTRTTTGRLPPLSLRRILCTVIKTGFVSDKFLAFISLVYLLPSPMLCFWLPPGVVCVV